MSTQLGHSSVKVTEQAYAKLLTATQRDELLRLGTLPISCAWQIGQQTRSPSGGA
jgi:hypothetical protein